MNNPHASTYMIAAYSRLLSAVQAAQPPAFDIFPTAEQFENAKEHASDLARIVDDYLHSFAVEAASNSTMNVSTKDRISIVSDALNDSGLIGDLQEAADDLREAEPHRSDREEHSTLNRSQQGV